MQPKVDISAAYLRGREWGANPRGSANILREDECIQSLSRPDESPTPSPHSVYLRFALELITNCCFRLS